jgi:hypothetical protein
MSDPIPKRRGNPAMVAGGPSLNPHGRPRRGQSIAEAIRRRVDPDRIAELAEQLAESAESETVRLAALSFLADRSEGRPVSTIDMRATLATRTPTLPPNWDRLPEREKRDFLERLRLAAATGTLALPDVIEADEVEQ